MALVLADRVRETTTTTGTGTITLAGAVAGFQSFAVIGTGNTTYYTISGGAEWEVGIGTYTSSGNTLSRDTVLSSSNSGSLVNFSAGTKDVFVTYPAEKSVNYDASDNVGIGNTNPGYKLEVTGDLRLGSGGDLRLGSATGTTGSAGDSSIYNDANDMYLNTNNVTRMYIANGGNVGIGNTTPGYRLDISSADTTAGLGYAMRIRANATAAGGTIQFTDSGVTAQWGFLAATSTAVTLDCSSAGSVVFRTNNSERMRIDSSGNVGIGTTSPNSKLDVVGDVIIGAALTTGTGASTGDVRVELGANRTGNGPCYIDWHSTAGTDFESRIIRYGGANGGMDIINMGTGGMVISQEGAAPLVFKTTATERMRIDSSGNVGVGTTSPTHKFQVEGQIKFGSSGGSIVGTHDGVNGNLTNDVGNFLFYTASSYGYIWHVGGINRFSIGSVGDLTSLATYNNTATGSTVVVTSTGAIRRTSSSIKYKKDVENLDPALVTNAVNNLRPVYYRTKNAEGDDKASWSHIGLIAEEVHEVEPRLVRYRTAEVLTDKEGNRVERELEVPEPEDVDYARLSVILLAKVKELETRIAVLEAK